MHWRLGEGIAAGTLALFIALVPYRSAADQVVLGRWSLPFVILLLVVLLFFLLAVAELRKPPLGPIDRGHQAPGVEARARGVDLGVAIWGIGYLIGTTFEPASRGRILAFDLLHSNVPAASFMEWGGLVAAGTGVLVWLWARGRGRFPLATGIIIALAAAMLLGEGVARWAASYRERPTQLPTAASARWDQEHVQLNASLFRDAEHTPVPAPGTSRLVLLGGSDAYGAGLEDTHQRLGEQIADRLEPITGHRWEAINAGVLLARTPDQIDAMRQVLGLGPRAVVVLYSFDDIEYLAPVASPRAPGEGAHEWRDRLDPAALLYANSILFQELYLRMPRLVDPFAAKAPVAADPYRDPTILGAHLGDLAHLVAAAGDSSVVVAIVPVDVEAASDPARLARYRAFVTSADSAGLPVWGVETAFQGHRTDELIIDQRFRHPNGKAIGLVADAVVDRLKDRLAAPEGRAGRGVP